MMPSQKAHKTGQSKAYVSIREMRARNACMFEFACMEIGHICFQLGWNALRWFKMCSTARIDGLMRQMLPWNACLVDILRTALRIWFVPQ